MEVKASAPDLKSYSDYRAFLRDWYLHRKARRTGFSYRQFAQRVGVRSPNYLQLVMKGQRNLSLSLAERVARVLELNKDEQAYFVALVAIEIAETPQERVDAHKKRLVALKKLLTRYVNAEHSMILEEWHHLLVRELVFLPGFRADGTWMSARLSGVVTPQQAEASFALLIKTGLIVAQPKGKYAVADPVLDTGDHVFKRALNLKHHAETLQHWGRYLPVMNVEEQERGLLNIPISSARLPELRRRIQAFQDEIIGWLQDESAPDRIVQLGTYLIPFGEPSKD